MAARDIAVHEGQRWGGWEGERWGKMRQRLESGSRKKHEKEKKNHQFAFILSSDCTEMENVVDRIHCDIL